MTQLALIPPLPHLDLGTTSMHLLLAHMCNDPKYLAFYRERRVQGDHIILDNSAFEFNESQASMAAMLAIGYYLQAQEIVAPDAIMDERKTYTRMLENTAFMETMVAQRAWRRAGKPRVMVVPQVDPETQEIDSYDRHARVLLSMWCHEVPYLHDHITLGVSKNMNKLHGGWLMLFREVIEELRHDFPIQVHALGCPKSIPILRKVLKENPYIRSLDTALPFVCATAGIHMDSNQHNELPRRLPTYLWNELRDEEVELAIQNIDFLRNIVVKEPEQAQPRLPTPRRAVTV